MTASPSASHASTARPKVVVRDRLVRRVDYKLDPEVERDALETEGRHPVMFAPERVRVSYDQPDLVATEGAWEITVEVAGSRIRRDHTLGEQIRSRTYTEAWPSWADVIVRTFHPDNPTALLGQGVQRR